MSNNQTLISSATQRNWDRLTTKTADRLKNRANKSRSDKYIRPDNYAHGELLDDLVAKIQSSSYSIGDIFTYLCIQKVSAIPNNPNVNRFLTEYQTSIDVGIHIPDSILIDITTDWLGFLYQASIPEGQRNIMGQYYTNHCIVRKMLSNVFLDINETFLDPCCGTGAFLMNVRIKSLSQLFGIDIDNIAIMIAKANLIALHPDDNVYPQLYCEDYLDNSLFSCSILSGKQFDYIYTNPPWGANKTQKYVSEHIVSNERSSLFFVKAFKQLKDNGRMNFLLPTSLLKVKAHRDLRSFILQRTKIDEIHIFSERFNGVYTDFFSINVSKQNPNGTQSYIVTDKDKQVRILQEVSNESNDLCTLTTEEGCILTKIESLGCYNLSKSIWALGIVTGDNKQKLKKVLTEKHEVIYTGKDIEKYSLKAPSNYILYNRQELQQCAKDEIYRAPEKLVYKFISNTLCFAYDNSSSLFLNSANILIPKIDGMSIKTVLAFLNSDVFSYYYKKKYTDIKVLKSNLIELPFPKISIQQDRVITDYVDLILQGDTQISKKLNEYIFSLYDLTPTMIITIKKSIYGNFDTRT